MIFFLILVSTSDLHCLASGNTQNACSYSILRNSKILTRYFGCIHNVLLQHL